MEEEKKLLLFLSMYDLTINKLDQIYSVLGEDRSLKAFFKSKEIEKLFAKDKFEQLRQLYDENRISNYQKNLQNQDIHIITRFDSTFPSQLKNLPDSPYFLFCKGDLTLLSCPSLAIVGTRKPSNYGRVVTDKFAKALAKEGIVIVSGLAYGIDSIAHRKCLEVGGKTIAVLGSGLNEIYPKEHMSLASEIASQGLLISEYSPNRKATSYTFPQRNRIIAGLSGGVLITEASIKSGTIHTKDFALDYGRNIYAVPGNIDSPSSELTNETIKSGQAMCVTSPSDILKDYAVMKKKEHKTEQAIQLSMDELKIVSLLQDGMKDIDYLAKNSNLSINIFNSYLTTLEIRGIISRLPGGYVVKN